MDNTIASLTESVIEMRKAFHETHLETIQEIRDLTKSLVETSKIVVGLSDMVQTHHWDMVGYFYELKQQREKGEK
jgi:hypothetical protein